MTYSQRRLDQAFGLLSCALERQALDTSDGLARFAQASEFMLMGEGSQFFQFKHRDSRNYVFLDKRTGALIVPKTDKFFLRGYFDAVNPAVWRALARYYSDKSKRGIDSPVSSS